MSMTVYDELVARGLVAQVTDEDEFYGKDLMDALPSSDDTFENENYTINSDEDKD